jgi:hypothetical protein
MSFDKNKANDIFSVTFSDEESNQIREIKETAEDFARRNATHSGMYLKAHIDLYKKHLKVRANYFIKALLELFQEDELIDEKDENELIKELSVHLHSQYNFKSSSLRSVTASTGLNKSGILSTQLSILSSGFNEIKSIKIKYLKQLIEKHNYNVTQIKKSNSFWDTKNGMLTAIGTIILAITSIIVLLNNFGIINNNSSVPIIPEIKKYEIHPSQLEIGNSAELTWNVANSDSVIIDNNIGMVTFIGSKKILPLKTTTYILSAYLNNKTLSISKTIIVIDSLNNIIK